jgi:predicted transposase YdaD
MSKMKIAKKDRPKVKAECLRLLLTLRLDPAKTRLVSKFVDTYLRLDLREEKTFQAEIDKLEPAQKEGIMETLTSWEERGMRLAALKMLQENIPLETIARVTDFSIEQIQQLQSQSSQEE